jgi:hypothetical protein
MDISMIDPENLGRGVSTNLISNTVYPLDITKEVFRREILVLQDKMISMCSKELEAAVDSSVEHFFAPGTYGRQMTISKGLTVIGKIHKHSHINIISKGVIDVMTEFGVARYAAPITFISNPTTKRIVCAIEETIWTCIHATDKTDLDEIEKELIADSYEGLS